MRKHEENEWKLMMPKEDAIAKIEKRLETLDAMRQEQDGAQKLDFWKNDVETLLSHIFGSASRQVEKFNHGFVPVEAIVHFGINRGSSNEWFQLDLKSAKECLTGILNEIKEYY